METIISIVSIVFSTISGVFSFYTFVWTKKRDRKQATLDAYNRLQEQALDQLNLYSPGEMRKIAEDPKSEEYKTVSTYIARIEHFCAGANQKIYDGETVFELANGFLNGSIKKRITPIIDVKNHYSVDHAEADRDYYKNIHEMYDWMDKIPARQSKKHSRFHRN